MVVKITTLDKADLKVAGFVEETFGNENAFTKLFHNAVFEHYRIVDSALLFTDVYATVNGRDAMVRIATNPSRSRRTLQKAEIEGEVAYGIYSFLVDEIEAGGLVWNTTESTNE